MRARAAAVIAVVIVGLLAVLAHGKRDAVDMALGSDTWARCAPAVAHGLGGIDSFLYTNSREAFEQNYRRGFRAFEADLTTTSDGAIVAAHDWVTPSRLPGIRGMPSLEVFLRSRIYGRYTPLDAARLVQLLAEYRDVVLLVDFKAPPDIAIPGLLRATHDTAILRRIVPIVRDPTDLKLVRSLYPFPSVVWTLHWSTLPDGDIISTARRYGIGVVVIDRFWLSVYRLRLLQASRLVTYLSSVNTEPERALYREWGGRGVFTDFLPPDSSCAP